MKCNHAEIIKIVDEIIDRNYRPFPIDLLDNGDAEGELSYINNMKWVYVRTIKDICDFCDDDSTKILDIGSFLGVMDIALSQLGFEVYAFDIPEFQKNERLLKLYENNNISVASGNLKNVWRDRLPYEDKFFDGVALCEVLEHLNFNPLPVLHEINRITKTKGIIYAGLPNQARFSNRKNLFFGRSICNPIEDFLKQLDRKDNMIVGIHWREYTKKEACNLIELMGYEVEKAYILDSNEIKIGETLNPWSKLKRFFFNLMPGLKGDLVVIGKKENLPEFHFWFTEANT